MNRKGVIAMPISR